MSHDLASALAAAAARRDVTTLPAGRSSTPGRPTPRPRSPRWRRIRASSSSTSCAEQLEQLVQGRAPRERLRAPAAAPRWSGVLDGREPAAFGTWVFYPWSRRLVHVLPEPLHRELRLDRNRYAITAEEQGGWPGCASPSPACRSGARSCRRWRTRASAASCGLPTSTCSTSRTSTASRAASPTSASSKVVLAAREVAELDPYVRVVAFPRGVDETRPSPTSSPAPT